MLVAEPPQAALQRSTQCVRAGEDRLAPFRRWRTGRVDVPRVRYDPGALRREEDVVATAGPAQPAAEQFLALPASVLGA